MKNLLTILAVLILSFSANAEESDFFYDIEDWTYTASYNFLTYHNHSDTFEDDDGTIREWNESNNFVGFRANTSDHLGFGVAYGENSYYEKSVILYGDLHDSINNYFDIGADVFLASGYEEAINGGILPGINPYVRFKHVDSGFSVKVGYMNFMAVTGFVEYTF